MSVKLPNGTQFAIASAYGAAKTMSAVSNAAEAVATLASSHGVVEGDILEVTSGWSGISGKVCRAGAVSTNDVTLESVNTSNTTKYPAGSGIGSVREVTAWTAITQILDNSGSGGEQQYTNYSFLEDPSGKQRQLPNEKTAESISLSLGDDMSLPWYSVLVEADEDKSPRALRATLPSGDVLFYNVYVSFNKTPTMQKNNVMALRASFSLVADPTRYAS